MKGDMYYRRVREVLRSCKCRRPEWISDLEAKLFHKMGSTSVARHHTMYLIERAAAGLGLTYKSWPTHCGVLVGQPLTINTDVEVLRFVGRWIEHEHGRDSGNGWAYGHALNWIKKYQARCLDDAHVGMLREGQVSEGTVAKISSMFDAPSFRDLIEEKEDENDENVDENGKTNEEEPGVSKEQSATESAMNVLSSIGVNSHLVLGGGV